MSDYASCPTCHGSGLVPLEVAERIETHRAVERDECRPVPYRLTPEQERALRAADNRAEILHRLAAQRAAEVVAA